MAEYFAGLKDTQPIYVAGIEAVKEYTSGQRIKKTTPRVKLIINPFVPPFVPVEIVSTDLGGLIQTCTWQKSRSMAYGSFEVTLAADERKGTGSLGGWPLTGLWGDLGPSMRDIFKCGMYAQVWIDGYHVMTGTLRSFRKKTEVSSRTYTAVFDELGAILTRNILKRYLLQYGETLRIVDSVSKILDVGGTQLGNV